MDHFCSEEMSSGLVAMLPGNNNLPAEGKHQRRYLPNTSLPYCKPSYLFRLFPLYFWIKNISLKCATTYLDSWGSGVDGEIFVKSLCTVTETYNLGKITTTFLVLLFMLYFLSQTTRKFSNALLCFTDLFCWLLPNPQLVCSAK